MRVTQVLLNAKIGLLLVAAIFIWHSFSRVVVPIRIVSNELAVIAEIKSTFNVDAETAKGIYYAARANDISPMLYARLIRSESNFNRVAVSPKNYKGIAQTPTATGRVKTDLMHGAEILKEKLKITHGDTKKALALYKGGNNPVAYRQAMAVLNQD